MSLTYKKFVSENNAIELYGGFRGYTGFSSFAVNGAYLIHKDIEGVENLRWYWGLGAGASFYTGTFSGGSTDLVISGYGGLEYTLEGTPVSFSVDWVPTIFIGSGPANFFGGASGGLAARYILGGEH